MKCPVVAIALLSVAACDIAASQTPGKENTATKASAPAAPDDTATESSDAWAGKWMNAAGGYIEITPTKNTDYTIFIKGGPDGPSAYQARLEGGMLRFSRGGEEQSVRVAGAECLTVALDETYCRDGGTNSADRSGI